MSSYCVIGSGISGATIANLLSKKNSVHIYDKARGPGGRSSFKRLNKSKGFDHGAQYISPKTIQFKKFIINLRKKKILKKWGGKHVFLHKLKKENKNHVKIIGCKGNNDISKHLIKNLKCNFQSELEQIKYIKNKWKLDFKNNQTKYYDKLILTCPFPQLKKLSKKFIKDPFIRQKIKMDANITVMIEIKKTNKNVSSYLFDDKILGWAAKENSKKRFKSNNDLWTLQSTNLWANKKINKNRENKEKNSKILIDRFFKLTGIKKTNKNISSYLFDDKILGWAAKENSKKRFKSNNDLWTLQSTNLWANKKINKNRENKEKNSKILIDQFFKLTGIKKTKILTSLNHGWKYSSNSRSLKVKSYWNDKLNLGVCADWFVGPRVEAGWISANDLFKKMNK